MKNTSQNSKRFTYPVSDKVFKQVYDSPAALPGKYKWLTKEEVNDLVMEFSQHNI